MTVLVGEEGFHVHDVLWMWFEADKGFLFRPLLDGELPKLSHLVASRPLYRVEEGEDWIGTLLDRGPSGASQQDGVIGAKDVVPVGAVVNHPRVLLALAVVDAFSYGGVGVIFAAATRKRVVGSIPFPDVILAEHLPVTRLQCMSKWYSTAGPQDQKCAQVAFLPTLPGRGVSLRVGAGKKPTSGLPSAPSRQRA